MAAKKYRNLTIPGTNHPVTYAGQRVPIVYEDGMITVVLGYDAVFLGTQDDLTEDQIRVAAESAWSARITRDQAAATAVRARTQMLITEANVLRDLGDEATEEQKDYEAGLRRDAEALSDWTSEREARYAMYVVSGVHSSWPVMDRALWRHVVIGR